MSLLDRITNAIAGNDEAQRATLAEKLTAAQADYEQSRAEHGRLALAAEEGDAVATRRLDKARADMEAAEKRIRDLQHAIAARDARSADEAAKAKALTREQFEAAGKAAITELGVIAGDADAQMVTLLQTLDKWAAAVQKTRPYLSDEGEHAVINAKLYLQACVSYKLRAFPGFSKNLLLTADLMDSWAQHQPKPDEWRRLLSK